MAQVQTNIDESIITIDRWYGINQSPDGESRLKMGEASSMINFQVTDGGALKKRSGTSTVAGLLSEYSIDVGTEVDYEIVERGESTLSLEMYSTATTDSIGEPIVSGTAQEVTYDTYTDYALWYYPLEDGTLKSFQEIQYTPRTKISEDRNVTYTGDSRKGYVITYDTLLWNGTNYEGTNATVANMGLGEANDKYVVPTQQKIWSTSVPSLSDFQDISECEYGYIEYWSDCEYSYSLSAWTANYLTAKYDESYYNWEFSTVTSVPNASADTEVKDLWSGFVGGREVICTACNGHLWELFQDSDTKEWSKISCGTLDTDESVHLFGFSERLYALNGSQYKVWDGETFTDVVGYVPIVTVSTVPSGGGTELMSINKLSPKRKAWYSPDGTAKVFVLPEQDLVAINAVISRVTGEAMTGYTTDLVNGKITFTTAPAEGVNTIEIEWEVETDFSADVKAMRYSETFNGAQDTRVFIYGDGSNKAFYSGLTYEGEQTAEYFPDLNEMAVGEANTPITNLIRQYGQMLAFKYDSAYSIYYDTLTLEDERNIAGFYVSPVNKSVGNVCYGQARIVDNKPRTLDAKSVVEWSATSSSYGLDQRNAKTISQRIYSSLREINFENAHTYYDNYTHEYYISDVDSGLILVNSTESDVWYVYTGLSATSFIRYKDELYIGTVDGNLLHFSSDYTSDNGEAINCRWESGLMSFGEEYNRKYSAMLWVGIKAEDNGYLKVTAQTDVRSVFSDYIVESEGTDVLPQTNRIKLKAKKFTFYKLIFENNTNDKSATVVSTNIRVRSTGYVR